MILKNVNALSFKITLEKLISPVSNTTDSIFFTRMCSISKKEKEHESKPDNKYKI